jgi:hypothetical protein
MLRVPWESRQLRRGLALGASMASMLPGTSRTRGHEDRAGMVSRVWPRQAQRRPTALSEPGVGPLLWRLDRAFGHTDHAGDLLHRQGRPPCLEDEPHTPPHAAQTASGGTNLPEWGAKPAVGRLWPIWPGPGNACIGRAALPTGRFAVIALFDPAAAPGLYDVGVTRRPYVRNSRPRTFTPQKPACYAASLEFAGMT